MTATQRTHTVLTLLLAALCAISAFMPQADAWPMGKKAKAAKEAVEKVQTFQPPPVDALATECEPIRQKILRINSGSKISRTLMSPRVAFLANKHNRCRANWMSQEFEYLKHADIEQSPRLPKLKTDAPPATQPQSDSATSEGEKQTQNP